MSDLTRPIIGIENRTAQEVFDIMCDRLRAAEAPSRTGRVKVEALVNSLLDLRDLIMRGKRCVADTGPAVKPVIELAAVHILDDAANALEALAAFEPAAQDPRRVIVERNPEDFEPYPEPAEPAEPDFAKSIAEVIKEECDSGAAAGWRSCTGCHETNEGYETGHYSYSTMFGCHVGHGCRECGGLGVVWEYWSGSALEAMARGDEPAAASPLEDDGCPKNDPECLGNNGDYHDACEWPLDAASTADGATEATVTAGSLALRPPGGRPRRYYYRLAREALDAAHMACFRHPERGPIGMSHGPFSGVNVALGIVATLESHIASLSARNSDLRRELDDTINALKAATEVGR